LSKGFKIKFKGGKIVNYCIALLVWNTLCWGISNLYCQNDLEIYRIIILLKSHPRNTRSAGGFFCWYACCYKRLTEPDSFTIVNQGVLSVFYVLTIKLLYNLKVWSTTGDPNFKVW